MAFLFSGPASDQPKSKPRRYTRLLQAGEADSPPSSFPDASRKVLAPPPTPVIGTGRTRLIPLTDWNQHHAWPPLGGLRHLVFFERDNGFDKVVRRVGRRVLIDEAAFFAWVDSKGGHHAAS